MALRNKIQTVAPRDQVDSIARDSWKLPEDVVNQFHLIAYSDEIYFTTFYFNANTIWGLNSFNVKQYIGGAKYELRKDDDN
jgi:hypothetical protein